MLRSQSAEALVSNTMQGQAGFINHRCIIEIMGLCMPRDFPKECFPLGNHMYSVHRYRDFSSNPNALPPRFLVQPPRPFPSDPRMDYAPPDTSLSLHLHHGLHVSDHHLLHWRKKCVIACAEEISHRMVLVGEVCGGRGLEAPWTKTTVGLADAAMIQ